MVILMFGDPEITSLRHLATKTTSAQFFKSEYRVNAQKM